MSEEQIQSEGSFDSLKEQLQRCMLVELLDSNQFVSKETVLLRVLRKLCDTLNIPWSSLLESTKTTYFIDRDFQNVVLDHWNQRNSASAGGGNANSADDQAVIERFLSRDYVRSIDLVKLAGVLSKRCSPHVVNQIFAVDGFAGMEPKRYVEFFKYPADDFRGRHVRFVRSAYERVPKAERVCAVIKAALDSFQNGSLVTKYLTRYDAATESDDDEDDVDSYRPFVPIFNSPEDRLEKTPDGNLTLFTPLMDYTELMLLRDYVDFVGYQNMEKIVEWKLKQRDNEQDSQAVASKKSASAAAPSTTNKRKRPSSSTGGVKKQSKKKVVSDSEVSVLPQVVSEAPAIMEKKRAIDQEEFSSYLSGSESE